MSINFVDETTYAGDMAELNDLLDATVSTSDPLKVDFASEDDPFGLDIEPEEDNGFFSNNTISANKDHHRPQMVVGERVTPRGCAPFDAQPPKYDFDAKAAEFMKDLDLADTKDEQNNNGDDFGGFGGSSAKKVDSVYEADKQTTDEDKKNLLIQIAKYRMNWPYLEQEIQFPAALHKKTVEKLQEIRDECSSRVQNRNTTKCLRLVFNASVGQLESICTSYFTSIELEGFAKACETNDMIQDSLLELEIKYFGKGGPMAPEARLIIGLLTTAVATHRNNSMRRRVTEACRSYSDPLPQYSDL